MRLYFSGLGGAQDHVLDFVKKNLDTHRALVSYAYPKHIEKLQKWGFDSLYLDSGAFTVFQKGLEIDHDEYLDWAEERKDSFDIITALDVIGDWEGSVKNFDYGRKRLDVWPVFHFGEPQHVLDYYMSHTNHICVGGIASGTVARQSIKRGLDWLFSLYPDMQLHVLGVNCFTALLAYPVYSCDALTWRSGSRFGDAFIRGVRHKVGKTSSASDLIESRQYLREHAGLDLDDPEFDWNRLDYYNILELYRMLEVEHEKIPHGDLVRRSYLF